jgi:adenylyltransferase/sulfurtransferase
MYETAHVGRAKVDAATERLAAINPEVTIESRRRRLTPREAVELADGMDLIVDGTDNFATRYLLNDLAVRTALPWVSGGAIGAEGQVFRVQPRRTPCLRCLWPDPTEDSPALTCAVQGVIGPIVAAVAAVQAAEAIKLLTAPESLPPANLIRLDLWAGVARAIDLGQPDPSCPCCAHDQMSFLEP